MTPNDTWQLQFSKNPSDFFAVRWRFSDEDQDEIEWEIHEIACFDERVPIFSSEKDLDWITAMHRKSPIPIEDGHIMHGDLKWDGTFNLSISDKEACLHFCDADSKQPEIISMLKLVFSLGPKIRSSITWGLGKSQQRRGSYLLKEKK